MVNRKAARKDRNAGNIRMARITDDVAYQDFSVDLSSDEFSFVTLTTWLSRVENGKHVQSHYTGQAEEDPSYNQYLPLKTTGENGYGGSWCDLYYQFSYHIADKQMLTVGERDEHIGNMLRGIEDFWNGTDMEETLSMATLSSSSLTTYRLEGSYFLNAAPLNLSGADGSPCRAVLIAAER